MDFFHKLLNYYHIDEKGYLELLSPFSFNQIPDISSYSCVIKAIKRLKKAKEKGEKVLIYGDYDCDGIMGASILKIALKKFGLEAQAYLPSRYLDGYGLNKENTLKIIKSYQLIITIDNGVSSLEALELAYQNNVDVIVIDHHEYESEPPNIVSLIHPHTVEKDSPSISAGFLAYLFVRALLKEDNDYLLMLGAISLLSDSMEIISYNRNALGLALSIWKEKGNIAFEKLYNGENKDETALNMSIIPTINAMGRMDIGTKINLLIKYFSAPETEEASSIALYALKINKERKEMIQANFDSLGDFVEGEALVIKSSLPEGINGLLANKIMERSLAPVAVYTPSNRIEGYLVGSIRSKNGCPLTSFMLENSDILVSGGGHPFASGFSLKEKDIDTFKERFVSFSLTHPFLKETPEIIELELQDISVENYQILSSFGPFGPSNKPPIFSLKVDSSLLRFSMDGKRLQTNIGEKARLFSFKYGVNDVPHTGILTLNFHLHENIYRGRKTISADIIEIIP